LAVGDGAVRFRGSLEAAGAQVPPDEDGVHRLRAEQVCKLGAEGSPTDRDALLPDYLREPDAVPRPMTAPPAAPAIRRLTYADLPQVVAIERRAFPTPWSLAMFVLELSEARRRVPGGVRGRDDGRLPDLLALRHGLAPDERVRSTRAGGGQGIATALLSR
jgi:hypothetical protein